MWTLRSFEGMSNNGTRSLIVTLPFALCNERLWINDLMIGSHVKSHVKRVINEDEIHDETLKVANMWDVNGTRSARKLIVVRGDEVEPKEVRWLWPGRLGYGIFTLVGGLPDVGKGLFFVDIAARLTVGSPMPPKPFAPGLFPPQR